MLPLYVLNNLIGLIKTLIKTLGIRAHGAWWCQEMGTDFREILLQKRI